jgi:hypothetical protein
MKRYLLFFIIFSLPCMAQERLAVTKAQHAALMKQRKKVTALARKLLQAQEEIQVEEAYAASELQALTKKIILENRWPADTQVDYATFTFFVRPPAAPPAAVPVTPTVENTVPPQVAPHGPAKP